MKLSERLLSERWAHWVATLIGVFALVVGLALSQTDMGRVLELRLLDERFLWRGPVEATQEIVVLGIDETSIDFFRDQGIPWPWPNRVYALALDRLDKMGAKVITFDKLFKDPTSGESDQDEKLLAKAARNHGKVIFATDLQKRTVMGNEQTVLEKPLPIVAESGALGFVDFPMDEDGAVRRVAFRTRHQDKLLYNLDLQSYLTVKGLTTESITVDPGNSLIIEGDLKIPLDFRNSAYINYPGKSPFLEYSFYTLFDPDQSEIMQDMGLLKDKIVYIGVTSELFHDDYTSPFSRKVDAKGAVSTTREYGVNIHASILHTLLTRSFIRPQAKKHYALTSILIGLLVVLILSRAGFKLSLMVSVGVALVYLIAGFYLFKWYGLYINLVTPLSCIAFPSVAMLYYKFLSEQTQKRQIRSYWSRYVSDEILDLMVKGELSVELGGQRKEVTVLMSDIRDFTPLCENLSATELISQLNEYFSEMAFAIFKYGGTIDKFIGDAVMAYWGFPRQQEDHAKMACLAGAEMIRRQKVLSEKWTREGKPVFRMGVGINTGEVIIGNVGAKVEQESIQNFTLLGDPVNLAARLESENKKHGTTIIVSESTWSRVEQCEGIKAEFLGEIMVKGKSNAIRAYRIDLDE